jgi:hypothetical protein
MRRGLHLALALLAVACLAGTAGAWYPLTTQVELATATWCTWCADAYTGIDLNKGWFDRNEFNSIRYYAASGGLGNATSTSRITYYGVTAYPNAFFDGRISIPGGNSVIATGLPYRSAIESELDNPTFFKLTINSVSFTGPTGSIDMNVEVMEDVPSITGMYLRIVLAEDNVTYLSETYQDVCRGSVPDIPITVSTLGQNQHVVQSFAIDPGWVSANMHLLAFVQQNLDKAVYASITSKPKPTNSLRYYALGNRIKVGPASPPTAFTFQPFRVYNTGTATDHYTISVAFQGPVDWTCILCDPHGLCYGPVYETDLDPGEYVDLVVDLWPHSSGYGIATVALTQNNIAPGHQRTIKYEYLSNDLEVLVMDDDGGQNYESYYADALSHFGHSFGVWDRDLQVPTLDEIFMYPIIVWSLGASTPTLDASDRASLGTYLDAGGRVMVSGQDLAYEMNSLGGAAYTWYRQYLQASYSADNSSDFTLDGVPGDPISTGLDLTIQGGTGANDQTSPDVIEPYGGFATPLFLYDATRKGAIKADNGNSKVVNFAFGFEAIDNADDRRVTLHRIIRWFENLQSAPDGGAPVFAGALSAFPSVVRSSSTVRFTLPVSGPASLQVFSTEGRLVRTLASGELAAGPHALSWDGTDAHGARLPAGVYCYRLLGKSADLQQKVVLVN